MHKGVSQNNLCLYKKSYEKHMDLRMLIIRSFLFNIILFSVISIALIIGYPLIFLKDTKYVFGFWYYLSLIIEFITSKIAGINYITEHEDNILKEPAIYAIRHESTWETLVLIHKFKKPIFVLKEELLDIPLFGSMAKKAGTIAIDRNNGTKTLINIIGKIEQSISNGHPIIIFPEGTRMPYGEVAQLKRGIALFYKKTNCPIVPVIHNSGLFWPRRNFVKKPGTITLKFLDPIMPGLSSDEFMDKLNDVFSTEIRKLETLDKNGLQNVF
jgi:1-acyl-sn-glycerol-3-phosphate acyltransferase